MLKARPDSPARVDSHALHEADANKTLCLVTSWIISVRVIYTLFSKLICSRQSATPKGLSAERRLSNPYRIPAPREFYNPVKVTLTREDSPFFISLLNLSLRRYISILSGLSPVELFQEFKIAFFIDPPANLQHSPRPYLHAIGRSKASLLAYRTTMLAQMSSHALGLCRISPRDAYEFRQPPHSEGYPAKESLRRVMTKLDLLSTRSHYKSPLS
ncbi:hypothetical protein L0F63_003385 [Massospora cicadina]|nr:hypothetical protein L0F63_003385 [Massospora cicadina]